MLECLYRPFRMTLSNLVPEFQKWPSEEDIFQTQKIAHLVQHIHLALKQKGAAIKFSRLEHLED